MSTLGSPVPSTVMACAATVPAKATMAPATAMKLRFIDFLLLSFFQYKPPLDASAVRPLFRDLQHQFLRLKGRAPDESHPLAAGTHAQDLHGLDVHAPR